MLVLYDLDGFRHYNDSLGHPAGDALLARRGRELLSALDGCANAYRMGGDEFSLLVPGDLATARPLIEAGADALCESGDGFTVTSTWSAVSLPDEATTPASALHIADERMYARKQGGGSSLVPQAAVGRVRPVGQRDQDRDSHPPEARPLPTASLGATPRKNDRRSNRAA